MAISNGISIQFLTKQQGHKDGIQMQHNKDAWTHKFCKNIGHNTLLGLANELVHMMNLFMYTYLCLCITCATLFLDLLIITYVCHVKYGKLHLGFATYVWQSIQFGSPICMVEHLGPQPSTLQHLGFKLMEIAI